VASQLILVTIGSGTRKMFMPEQKLHTHFVATSVIGDPNVLGVVATAWSNMAQRFAVAASPSPASCRRDQAPLSILQPTLAEHGVVRTLSAKTQLTVLENQNGWALIASEGRPLGVTKRPRTLALLMPGQAF
jgi:hypothetical protein